MAAIGTPKRRPREHRAPSRIACGRRQRPVSPLGDTLRLASHGWSSRQVPAMTRLRATWGIGLAYPHWHRLRRAAGARSTRSAGSRRAIFLAPLNPPCSCQTRCAVGSALGWWLARSDCHAQRGLLRCALRHGRLPRWRRPSNPSAWDSVKVRLRRPADTCSGAMGPLAGRLVVDDNPPLYNPLTRGGHQ